MQYSVFVDIRHYVNVRVTQAVWTCSFLKQCPIQYRLNLYRYITE